MAMSAVDFSQLSRQLLDWYTLLLNELFLLSTLIY